MGVVQRLAQPDETDGGRPVTTHLHWTTVLRVANLFGRNKLHDLAATLTGAEVAVALETVSSWHEDYHSGSLKKDKETSREQAYNRDFFISMLGYREKPGEDYTFEPKATTQKKQLPDAILRMPTRTFAVIELKGASVGLDKPQSGESNLSPVQQGFKYKSQYRSCPFVIVSNFYEFRLYNDNQMDFERWTLDDLVDPESNHFKLRTFLILLHSRNMLAASGPSRTEQLLSDIRIEQEEIGKDFYRVYKEARLTLLRHLYSHNESVRNNIELGIEKAQKIIDRLVFSCFAEDRGLLPDNIIQRVTDYSDGSAFNASLWHTFCGFFEAVNSGSERLEIPDGYNGGLFAEDLVLNAMSIPDAALRPVLALSKYNFVEDLSVNILGHIFEQSISDLDDIRSKVFVDGADVEGVVDYEVSAIGRRKREGIFYTPDYIVRYIVENTLGNYLRAEEARCVEEARLNSTIKVATYRQRERTAYLAYQDRLQSVRVLDPACGSGAFLVHVFDFLLAENMRVDSILGGSLLSQDEYVRDILRNNLYGVDLNDESVEITKLSLWLKTAQRGKKLTTLDSSVMCGNSLVEDKTVAGDKAFNWSERFKHVMASGGFHVVVGNPPYVRSRDNVLDNIREYIEANFVNLHEKANLYLLFMEKSLSLVRPDGYFGFVVPNSWLGMESAEKTREMILTKTRLQRLVNMTGESFENVSVEAVIFTCQKGEPRDNEIKYQTISSPAIEPLDYETAQQSRWLSAPRKVFDVKSQGPDFELLDHLDEITDRVEDHYLVRVGLQAYERGRGTPAQTAEDVKNHPFDYDHKFDANTYPYLEGRDVARNAILWSGQWLRHGEWLSQPKELSQFTGPRLLVREITGPYPRVLLCTYTEDIFLNNKSILNIRQRERDYSLQFLLGVLNSPVISFYHQRRAAKGNRTLFPKVVAADIKHYPLPDSDQHVRDSIHKLASEVFERNAELIEKSAQFQALVKHATGVKAWPRTLAAWWTLSIDEFLDALPSQVALKVKGDVLTLFKSSAPGCLSVEAEREQSQAALNAAVFDLYKLSDNERKQLIAP